MKSHKSWLITVEGGEGVGKTTLIQGLEKELTKQQYPVIMTREPGSTALGEALREIVLHKKCKISAQAELLLFLSARAQHLEEVIRPALKSGKLVLCDRFNDSTIVYQGIARELGEDKVREWCQLICAEIEPDLTLLLDLDPLAGKERLLQQRHAMDRIEQEQQLFHQKIRQGFLKIAQAEPNRLKVLNANQSIEVILELSLKYIKELK